MVSTRSSTKDKMPKETNKDKKTKESKKAKEPKEPTNYMKKYRKDPDAVYREDRLKRLRAIRSGAIPTASTLQK